MVGRILMLVLLGSLGVSGSALQEKNQATTSVPEAVSAYSRELTAIRLGKNINVEDLLKSGRKAAHALVTPKNPGTQTLLEELSEEEFRAVAEKMEGFWLNRQETIYVEPDPSFFLTLAQESGDQPSIAFFKAFGRTFEHGWPVYHQQQTDYSGCIRFGSMSLVDAYRTWSSYRQNHPNRYSEEVQNIIKDLEENLTEGTCSCGRAPGAVQEFEAFVRAFPNSLSSKRLRVRINQIKKGKSNIRWKCISG
jgi:hypothetical protein